MQLNIHGPGKWELAVAVFDRKAIEFETDDNNAPHSTVLTAIKHYDDSGHNFIIEASDGSKGIYNTDARKGYIEIKTEKIK